ncbi:MAG: CLC_0170 family protein [Clostridium sp.]|uniref:CLC_0170 family protein n=1 Tax=Clostridium sp. TaxID=1506 RepID=UPI003021D2B9
MSIAHQIKIAREKSMLRTLVERFDIYLVILVLVAGYMLIVGDVRYFSREDKNRAKIQSLVIGIGMVIITVSMYIVRWVWL